MAMDDALLRAFLANRGTLLEIAAPIVGCRYRAEDVVQDAFMKLSGLGAVHVRQPAYYLFRLVRNLAIDRARRLAVEARYGGREEVPVSIVASTPSPEDAVVARDLVRVVDEALAELPARTRLAFEMHRLGGATQQEVADRLGISVSLVALLIRDALTHCRDRLRAAGASGR